MDGEFLKQLWDDASSPSWRRIVSLTVIVGLILLGLFVFERYSATVRLGRLQKEAELLFRLKELEAQGTNVPLQFQQARAELMSNSIQVIGERHMDLSLKAFGLQNWQFVLLKFTAGFLVWLFDAVFLLLMTKNAHPALKPRNAIRMYVGFGVVGGAVGVFLPHLGGSMLSKLIFIVSSLLLAIPATVFFFALLRAKYRAQEIGCSSNLKQIGLWARIWSREHDDHLPTHLSVLQTEPDFEKVNRCKADRKKSYILLSPGAPVSDPSIAYIRCPIHRNVALSGGSVQMLKPDEKLELREGKWRIVGGRFGKK